MMRTDTKLKLVGELREIKGRQIVVAEHFYPAVNDLGDLCTLIGVG